MMECLHVLTVMNNRLLDDVETGGGDIQGHGMVLALHLVKHLKSYRKFSELLTKKYAICDWLHCLRPFHKQITVSTCVCTCITEDRAGCVYLASFCGCCHNLCCYILSGVIPRPIVGQFAWDYY